MPYGRLPGTSSTCPGRCRRLFRRHPGPLHPCPWARPNARTARGPPARHPYRWPYRDGRPRAAAARTLPAAAAGRRRSQGARARAHRPPRSRGPRRRLPEQEPGAPRAPVAASRKRPLGVTPQLEFVAQRAPGVLRQQLVEAARVGILLKFAATHDLELAAPHLPLR
eukprot:3280945-Alexandrium_andersonii.AAC.1